jgi:hypothetical protein
MSDELREAIEQVLREQAAARLPAPNTPMTLRQFCAVENVSIATLNKWRRAGIGPRVSNVPGMTLQRITPADYKTWKKQQAARERDQTDRIEAERAARVERNTRAAKLAVQSPRHVSNVKRKKQKQS